jgi:hypothetical protein
LSGNSKSGRVVTIPSLLAACGLLLRKLRKLLLLLRLMLMLLLLLLMLPTLPPMLSTLLVMLLLLLLAMLMLRKLLLMLMLLLLRLLPMRLLLMMLMLMLLPGQGYSGNARISFARYSRQETFIKYFKEFEDNEAPTKQLGLLRFGCPMHLKN